MELTTLRRRLSVLALVSSRVTRTLSCRHVGQRVPTAAMAFDGRGHAVVGCQDEALGAVLAEVAFFVLADHRERVQNMFGFSRFSP